jgi:hypothetical protein
VLRDCDPTYVSFGSFTTDAVEATRACMSAVARKRTNGPTSWDVRFVPGADNRLLIRSPRWCGRAGSGARRAVLHYKLLAGAAIT